MWLILMDLGSLSLMTSPRDYVELLTSGSELNLKSSFTQETTSDPFLQDKVIGGGDGGEGGGGGATYAMGGGGAEESLAPPDFW